MPVFPKSTWLILSPLALSCAALAAQPGPTDAATPQQATEQAADDQTPASAPADQPADDGRNLIMAKVIELHGDVKHAPLESKDWQPVKLGDEFPEHTKILTGVRSSVKFQIGDEQPYTCMLVESAGLTILSEAAIVDGTKRVRVGVGYGRIRAGVAEGGIKSEFTVDSPVATLSKRGTWGFTLYYERDTNIFEIGLTNRGLVEAISRLSAQRRSVKPRELVTQAMRRWLDQREIMQNVAVADVLGQEDIDVAFNTIRQDGLGVLNPGGGGGTLLNLSDRSAQAGFARRARNALGPIVPIDVGRQPALRAEGFFGTGRGDELVEVLINANDPLVTQGFARPGVFKFRRAALQTWVRKYGK